ncbi:hypothetical protein DFJ73DRAFT_251876 [Zopfochytrium polystomum]|nr:hypothetical protein DFJ73DRAFT_251876 [Zopfochytrium polystomum]
MASSIPPSVSPTAAASLSSSSSSSLRSLPPPRSTSLRASASSRTSLTSRSTVESVLRLLLTLLIAVPIVLLALRDVRHLTQLYLWRQRTVSRAVLFLHWRSKTFHVEAQQVDHVVPWGLAVLAIGALAVGARPGRRAIVPRVAVLAVMGPPIVDIHRRNLDLCAAPPLIHRRRLPPNGIDPPAPGRPRHHLSRDFPPVPGGASQRDRPRLAAPLHCGARSQSLAPEPGRRRAVSVVVRDAVPGAPGG